jgi:hypothetical protein
MRRAQRLNPGGCSVDVGEIRGGRGGRVCAGLPGIFVQTEGQRAKGDLSTRLALGSGNDWISA